MDMYDVLRTAVQVSLYLVALKALRISFFVGEVPMLRASFRRAYEEYFDI